MRGEAELGESIDRLKHDEESDHDQRRQLHDRDEDPEEDERRDPRGGEHDDVRAEDPGDRAGRADHRFGLHEALADRGHDPAQDVKDEVLAAPESLLDVVAEDP